jgi:hypothetical protein
MGVKLTIVHIPLLMGVELTIVHIPLLMEENIQTIVETGIN